MAVAAAVAVSAAQAVGARSSRHRCRHGMSGCVAPAWSPLRSQLEQADAVDLGCRLLRSDAFSELESAWGSGLSIELQQKAACSAEEELRMNCSGCMGLELLPLMANKTGLTRWTS